MKFSANQNVQIFNKTDKTGIFITLIYKTYVTRYSQFYAKLVVLTYVKSCSNVQLIVIYLILQDPDGIVVMLLFCYVQINIFVKKKFLSEFLIYIFVEM